MGQSLRALYLIPVLASALSVLGVPDACATGRSIPRTESARPRQVQPDIKRAVKASAPRSLSAPRAAALNETALNGELAGSWNDVTGWIGFPHRFEGADEELFVLARGLPAESTGATGYRVDGWDGQVFWIDLGDGVPHVLPAQLIDADFVPGEDDALTEAGRIYVVGYVLYRAAGVDYPASGWEWDAVLSNLVFVTDENDQVVDMAVDLYDDDDNFIETRRLQSGDQLQVMTNAYDLSDPNVIVLIEYMDFNTLAGEPAISKAHRLPGVEFTDQDLIDRSPELDTSALELQLVLEGENDAGWAYGAPVALGYTWGEAKTRFADAASSSGGGGAIAWPLLFALAGVAAVRARRRGR